MKKLLSIITILCLVLLAGCAEKVHLAEYQVTVGQNSIK